MKQGSLQLDWGHVRPKYMQSADNTIEWPLKSTSININDQYTCFLKCHAQHFSMLSPPVFVFLLVA